MVEALGALASLAIAFSLVFLATVLIAVVFLLVLACLAGATSRHAHGHSRTPFGRTALRAVLRGAS
ncbi:hypothetical protein ACWGH8_40735 [Nonomuraea muscovyensis]|uniref:Uncharacterized protein n=1 Tax=Nonomuraea muscovyensis TaxID=1124761 RepID=A0A7X0C1M8_9ACTN|nr:hypothetical protein [Nonomuraea muscovyensis]MBB6346840.1 hypothetical protein [Nonomuraea muscovyensis]MDF2712523.1 hypothetical protein [Nonomuraea muscovyensis]